MISAIDAALQQINFAINPRILNLAFSSNSNESLDSLLKSFIAEQILPRCNLKGGKMVPITLRSEWAIPIHNEAGLSLFEIPYEYRDGREIIGVGEVNYRPTNVNGSVNVAAYGDSYGGPVQELTGHYQNSIYPAMQMLRSKIGADMGTGAPIAEAMAGNMVKLHPSNAAFVPWTVYCRLAYDSELTNLNSGAIDNFAKLTVVGLKLFCHNRIIYNLDAGQIEFGTPLESIRETVARWGDLHDEFEELLNKFSGSTVLDIHRITNLLRDAL